MSLLFLSHSSRNNPEAIALHDWLLSEGWDDLFLDLDPQRGIVAGERWERALHQAANRCDAVLFLVSSAWLASEWCRREFRLAQKLNKQIFGLLIEEIPIASLPPELTESWQLVDLVSAHDHLPAMEVMLPDGQRSFVYFSESGLARLKAGLSKAGLDPRFFSWPPAQDPQRSPYRGLLPLEAEDAGILFGREAPIIEAMGRIRGLRDAAPPRFLAILGASGAGKSSFLRAGLLPRLSRDDRHFLPLPVIRPEAAVLSGANGFEQSLVQACEAQRLGVTRRQLKEAIAGSAGALLPILGELCENARLPTSEGEGEPVPPQLALAVDQAEELFLGDGQAEAEAFLDLLSDLLRSEDVGLQVLCTIRSDSYEDLQTTEALAGIHQHTFSLPPLPVGMYQQVIEGPARLLAETDRPLTIDPHLTQALMEDLQSGGGKDALPLLAFTLERLYRDYGGDGDLRLDEYRQMGGVEGAIEAAVSTALDRARQDPKVPGDEEQCLKLARRGFIPWLAGIDTEGKPRRKVAKLNEVPPEARAMIEHFIEQRLLSTDADEAGEITVEPAHEALLRQWGVLRGWLDEDAGAYATQEGLISAARDWEANGREDNWLAHTAGRLEDAEALTLREGFREEITRSQREYLGQCRQADDQRKNKELEDARELAAAQAEAAEKANEAAEKSNQVVKRTRLGLVVALLLLVVAGTLAYMAQQSAQSEARARQQAQRSALSERQAKDRALLTQSNFLMDQARQENWAGRHDTGLLLALNAMPGRYGGDRPTPPAVGPLYQAALLSSKLMAFVPEEGDSFSFSRFSPDQRTFLTAFENGDIFLWSVESGERLHTLEHDGEINVAWFSPDGQTLVTVPRDSQSAVLWAIDTGERLHALEHDNEIEGAEFSPHGQIIAILSDDAVSIWSVKTGEHLQTLNQEQGINGARFNPDGHTIVTASDGAIVIWSLESGERLQTLRSFGSEYSMVVASPDWQAIMTVTDHTASLWSVETGEKLHELQHENDINEVSFSPDGLTVLTASRDDTAALWSAETGEQLYALKHPSVVDDAEFSSDGNTILTAWEDTVSLWSTETGDLLHEMWHDELVRDTFFSPDGRILVTKAWDDTTALWSVETGELLNKFYHLGTFWSVYFTAGGREVLTISDDGTAAVWPVEAKEYKLTPEHDSRVRFAKFSPDSRIIATASLDAAEVWSVETGKHLHSLKHAGDVEMAGFSPDGQIVLTTGLDGSLALWETTDLRGTAALWSIDTGERLHTLAHDNDIEKAGFSPDGLTVVTGTSGGTAELWSVETGAHLHTLEHGVTGVGVSGAQFSPDGQTILTNSIGTTNLWSVESGELLYALEDGMPVKAAEISSDGQTIMTSSVHSASLWSLETGERLHTLHYDEEVSGAVFNPEGKTVLTTYRNTAAVWSLETGERLHTLDHDGQVSKADFSPDNHTILTVSENTASLWSLDSGERLHRLQHEEKVDEGVFSTDGRTVLTTTYGDAVLWSVENGEALDILPHESELVFAGFSPNGLNIVTVQSGDDLYDGDFVNLYPVIRLNNLVQTAIDRLPRNKTCLTPNERGKFFLADLTDKQWNARGCPRFARDKRAKQ